MDAIDMYYQFGLERLKSQEALNREYGNKAANILAFGLALVVAAAVVINLPGSDTERSVQFWILLGGLGTIFLFRSYVQHFCVAATRLVLRPTRSRLSQIHRHFRCQYHPAMGLGQL